MSPDVFFLLRNGGEEGGKKTHYPIVQRRRTRRLRSMANPCRVRESTKLTKK